MAGLSYAVAATRKVEMIIPVGNCQVINLDPLATTENGKAGWNG
jgi:hypothetical protein